MVLFPIFCHTSLMSTLCFPYHLWISVGILIFPIRQYKGYFSLFLPPPRLFPFLFLLTPVSMVRLIFHSSRFPMFGVHSLLPNRFPVVSHLSIPWARLGYHTIAAPLETHQIYIHTDLTITPNYFFRFQRSLPPFYYSYLTAMMIQIIGPSMAKQLSFYSIVIDDICLLGYQYTAQVMDVWPDSLLYTLLPLPTDTHGFRNTSFPMLMHNYSLTGD